MRALRVFLCDDSDGYRQLLRALLAQHDDLVVVGEAADGQQAADAVAGALPDAIVLDVRMPVLDGLQALPLLLAEAPQATVFMLSGEDEDALRDQAHGLGARGYFVKGAGEAALIAELRMMAGAVAAGASVRTLRAFE